MAATRTRKAGDRYGGTGRHAAGQPVGPQGTLGGPKQGVGVRPGRTQIKIGDEGYLWILIAIEVLATAWLRQAFKRRHGG